MNQQTGVGGEINVRVATRIRPLLKNEILTGEKTCVRAISSNNQIVFGKDKIFTFDHVYPVFGHQLNVFSSCVLPLIRNFFEGYNSTVFAYGQTGSGKTYTMGTSNQIELLEEERGIVPRAIDEIFNIIRDSEIPKYSITASFIEIYKEDVRDLLDSGELVTKDIHIREDDKGNTIVCGIYEHLCETKEDLLECLEEGSANRVTRSTQMNEHSSRSHCVFTITLVQEWPVDASIVNATSGRENASRKGFKTFRNSKNSIF
ncbi:unnamed protein product [Protopolystoma xenopodis]|uniref:Kinesin motor domain-containing protein n=1 Tax=Protopolystoma xenopodis TaxID=117903 RepID=A0A3S5BDP1_9PLAT|nr:unnamed protein product [Protopolystoma xenopodis]